MFNAPKAYSHFVKNGLSKSFRQARNPEARPLDALKVAFFHLGPFTRKNLLGTRLGPTLFGGHPPAGVQLPEPNVVQINQPKKK